MVIIHIGEKEKESSAGWDFLFLYLFLRKQLSTYIFYEGRDSYG